MLSISLTRDRMADNLTVVRAHDRAMWERLDNPQISEMTLQSCRPVEAPALAALLRQASARPWAAELYVVTSLDRVYLTAQRAYDDKTAAGYIRLSVVDGGQIAFSYIPPRSGRSVMYRSVPLDEALGALEMVLLRLFEEHCAQETEVVSSDKDPKCPRFNVGTLVRVVLNERNRTPHEGRVARVIWHHKLGCWMYFIEEHGKNIKKRYLGDDLER